VKHKTRKQHEAKTRPARPPVQFAGLRPLLPVIGVCGVLFGVVCGLEVLRHRVHNAPEYNPPLRIKLEHLPGNDWVEQEGWLPRIASAIQLSKQQKFMDSDLLRSVADQILKTGWVRTVEQVRRDTDGTVRVACDYRRPIAMVLTNRGKYIPIDKDGVRLPEEYDNVDSESGWMRILGVQAEPPQVGHSYGEAGRDEDAVAAVKLAGLLFAQDEIAPRISGIDVANFGGREDKHKTHIRLYTRDGRWAKWGSAPGSEVYEPDVADKLKNLVLWLKRGSPQAYADLTAYRNGVLAPIGQ
jgi:hypothetical protein